jgi:hypothetical protein
MTLRTVAKQFQKLAVDNAPTIMTAFGISGTITTAYFASKASIKASQLIEEEEIVGFEGKMPVHKPLSKKEVVKLVWKLYIPTAISGAVTIASIFGANHVSTKRAAAVATAYSLSERAFTEYKDKVVEKIGEKKEQTVREEIAQERVNATPVDDNVVILTGDGEVLCFDRLTGRYFKSNMESIKAAENEINHMILQDGYASATDLYYQLGLPPTSFTDEIGWNTDKLLKLDISTVMSPDNRPCIAIGFDLHPSRNFSSFGEG